MPNSIEVILNSRSGSQRAAETRLILERVLSASTRSFQITMASGDALARVAREKAMSGCDVLVAGGGDGTISRVAEAALRADKTLGVLPLGTFNYFARSHGIPLELEGAVRVILEGSTTNVSVFDLDDRLVLNNVSIGIIPTVLLKRRRLYQRWGRNQFNAYLSVLLTIFRPAHRMRLRLATDSAEAVRETPLVLICSNAYQIEAFQLAGRECLAAGQFALYVARLSGRKTILHLGLRALIRHLRPGQDYDVICASDVMIETLRRREFRATVDGELVKLKSPMRFRVLPTQLRVLAPAANEPPSLVVPS